MGSRICWKGAAALAFAATLAGCGGGQGSDTGVRRVGNTIIVDDVTGPSLIVDANGCQSIAPSGGGRGVPVLDSGGRQVCAGPQG